jgi:AAA15 family ATPase/GTPase
MEYCSQEFRKQKNRTILLSLRAIFDFKTSFLKKVHEIKKKSPCLGDSKHIFKLKIAQVIPKKNMFKKSAGFTVFTVQ